MHAAVLDVSLSSLLKPKLCRARCANLAQLAWTLRAYSAAAAMAVLAPHSKRMHAAVFKCKPELSPKDSAL